MPVINSEVTTMKLQRTLLWVLACLALVAMLAGCGGGSGTPDPDTTPPIGDNGEGGDPGEPNIPGQPLNPFAPPNGTAYVDIRGIASSREFVYIGDQATLYCFDKRGNLRNVQAAPETIQGVTVFPATVAEEVSAPGGYLLANAPVISHNPVDLYGYVTVYAPGLDTTVTREDGGAVDARRLLALPHGGEGISPPDEQPDPWVPTAIYDVKVDRYGSILLMMDLDIPGGVTPDYPRTLQVFSRFALNDTTGQPYYIQQGGQYTFEDQNQGGGERTVDVPGVHRAGGLAVLADVAVGDFDYYAGIPDITPFDWVNLGKLAVDTLSPPRLSLGDNGFNLALNAANFQRDYVGIQRVNVTTEGVIAPDVADYSFEPAVADAFGYRFVIGDLPGAAPGSFSSDPSPQDPDLTAGGPSGMCFDPRPDRNKDLYVCDPGNSRIQIFRTLGQSGPWEFVDQIVQDSSGRPLIAPSSVTVDPDGNVFIGDVDEVRRVIRRPIQDTFGAIGGTVRNGALNIPLQGATVTLRSQDGFTIGEVETTDINGQYLFENLPVGNYFMSAGKFNFNSDTPTQAITVQADKVIIVNFNLFSPTPENFGNYVGNIRDADTGKFIAGVSVQILGTGLETESDANGHFEIPNIPPGTYQVLFADDPDRNAYQSFVEDLVITTGQTTAHNFLEMNPL
jgi:hypothetical protein